MKKLFYLLAVLSLVLFAFSIYNLTQHSGGSSFLLNLHLNGFEETTSDPAHDAAKAKLVKNMTAFKAEVDKDESWYFWLSFLVTGLTAASTLVSSIQAAKTAPATPPAPATLNKFSIIVAVLTFLSTLTNFGSTHFSEKKNTATKNLTAVTQDLNDFYRKYDAAKTDAERAEVVKEYDEKTY